MRLEGLAALFLLGLFVMLGVIAAQWVAPKIGLRQG